MLNGLQLIVSMEIEKAPSELKTLTWPLTNDHVTTINISQYVREVENGS